MMIFVFSMGGFKVMLLSREGLWENIAFLAVALAWAGSCKFPIHYLFILFFRTTGHKIGMVFVCFINFFTRN